MRFRAKPRIVDAMAAVADMVVGGKPVKEGDYLVKWEDGHTGVMKKAVFEAFFEPDDGSVTIIGKYGSEGPDPEEIKKPEEPHPRLICLGCGSEFTEEDFDRASGMCKGCLGQLVECNTCGAKVKQYQKIGLLCVNCVKR